MGAFDLLRGVLKATLGPIYNKPPGVVPPQQTIPYPVPSQVARIGPQARSGSLGNPNIPGASQFSADDPYLSGGEPLPAKDGFAPPRAFQYPPGYNIAVSPRSTEAISYAQLRLLADYSIVRIVIEHVKEGLKSHEWDITTDEGFERTAFRQDITECKKFFERPDRDHSWDEWLGMLIEEVLVPDALTVYKHKTYDGSLHSLEIIDGTTIKVLCDTRGFLPKPPAPAYQQFLYGIPKTWYTSDELIYAIRNRRAHKFYGLSPVEQIILKVNEGIRRDFYNLAQFSDGNTPAGIATLPKEWSLEQIKGWSEWFDQILAGNAQRRSKLFWAPEGTKVEKFHDDEVFGLFNKYDEWLARIVCFTFGVSPVPFISMSNRAVAQELGDVEAEGGVASIKLFIERLINDVIDNDLLKPHLRFNWITDRSRLQEKRVKKNTEYAKAGIFTVNEIRLEEGLDPMPGVGDELMFNGQPLGQAPPPMGGGFGGPMSSAAPSGDPSPASLPARPVLPDGSRPVIEAAGSKALKKAALEDLDKWERFALSRLAEGKLAEAGGFESEYLSPTESLALCKAIAKAKTKDQLKDAFAARRAGVKALRIEPASPGEIAEHTGKVRDVLRDILGARAREIASSGEKSSPAPAPEPVRSLPLRKADTFVKVAGPLVANQLAKLLKSRRG